MKTNTLFTHATVVLSRTGADTVMLHTELPQPVYCETKQGLVLTFQAGYGQGVAYVKEHFGLDAEVIERN